MGFKRFIKKQLLDIIEWEDRSQNTLVYKFPTADNEIQNGGQLIVRPGQVAIFVDKGKVADVFEPGTHLLTTDNLPILSDLQSWSFGFKSPFKSDVYFVNVKQFLNNKWGTQTPFWMNDTQFGQVEVRAYGTYIFQIQDPVAFVSTVSSTNRIYTVEDIQNQLNQFILTHFTPIVASLQVTISQLAMNYNIINEAMIQAVKKDFKVLGLEMASFIVSSINFPKEISDALRKLTQMNIYAGANMQNYAAVETLEVMKESAKNPSANSMSQAGIGMGMGMQMGQMMGKNLGDLQEKSPQNTPNSSTSNNTVNNFCTKCGSKLGEGAAFCGQCGNKI